MKTPIEIHDVKSQLSPIKSTKFWKNLKSCVKFQKTSNSELRPKNKSKKFPNSKELQ